MKEQNNLNLKKALGLTRAWGAYIKTLVAAIIIRQSKIDETISNGESDVIKKIPQSQKIFL